MSRTRRGGLVSQSAQAPPFVLQIRTVSIQSGRPSTNLSGGSSVARTSFIQPPHPGQITPAGMPLNCSAGPRTKRPSSLQVILRLTLIYMTSRRSARLRNVHKTSPADRNSLGNRDKEAPRTAAAHGTRLGASGWGCLWERRATVSRRPPRGAVAEYRLAGVQFCPMSGSSL